MPPSPQQLTAGTVPPEVVAQLLGGKNPYGQAAAMPKANSPEFRHMVQTGSAAMPQPGSIEFLDFMQANPDLAGMQHQPGQPKPAGGVQNYNPFAVLSNLLAQPQPQQ